MYINNKLMFSTKTEYSYITKQVDKLSNVTIDIQDDLCDKFIERIRDFYYNPAEQLLKSAPEANSFAAGVILLTMIDALSVYTNEKASDSVKVRYKNFLAKYFGRDDKQQEVIYENYRNGLIHEGRIKQNNAFTYDDSGLIAETPSQLTTINTKKLLEACSGVIKELNKKLKNDKKLKWRVACRIKEYF